ncbi:hypothetical protein ACFFSW_14130 [Saccharothrix longispora]|uniref:HNH endonuclease n=1 Tax=Saccharothrix longispora TaxID=33920 RepID=A0ABU1Q060_9PSEU|nr:hypothetical protein [Saccharothrix longispora]MDR6595794.1 hypothetical protein [Saccharothrix longispora]
MPFTNDSGRPLHADFAIEAEGDGLSLVLASSSGRAAGRDVRNPDYREALELLLRRLGDRRAVVSEVLVDSLRTQQRNLPEEERRLVREPLRLAPGTDFLALRRQLTRAQRRIGQSEGATTAGNGTRRIRLRLEIPEYGPQDAARLQRELERPQIDVVWPAGRVDVADELRVRIGEQLPGGGHIVAVPAGAVVVETAGGRVEVPVGDVQVRLDRFTRTGTAPVEDVVGALVAVAAGAGVEDGRAVRTPLKRTVRQFAELDGRVTAKYRKEQGALRSLLVGDDEVAPCALCGRPFPVEFLVAAHVKKRQVATDDERQDLENIAMLACSFGCDKLFELGYVTVGEDGAVLTASTGGPLDLHLELLRGRVTESLHDGSAPYFRWHRENVFRG